MYHSTGSRPPRARGLKLVVLSDQLFDVRVAPPAGAWIETQDCVAVGDHEDVAPPAGAWIETILLSAINAYNLVAPPAGAWIETFVLRFDEFAKTRRAPRGRVD